MAGLGWMRSDPSLRIASLILAVLIWMYVRGEERPVQLFTVPLQIEGIPRDLALAGEKPESVAVRVRAPDATLKNLSPGRFQAKIRLNDPRPGALTIPLDSGDIKAPIGVEVLQVEPRSVSLRLERRLTRVFAGVRLEPAFPAGAAHQVELQPDTITVELEATREVLDALNPVDIKAILDLEGMPPRDAPYPVRPRIVIGPAEIASQVTVQSVSDEIIQVRIDQ